MDSRDTFMGGDSMLQRNQNRNLPIKKYKNKKHGFFKEIRINFWLYLLILPAILFALIFRYLPMVGITIAFQDYNPIKGIFGSKFIGFSNFRYFFRGSQWF